MLRTGALRVGELINTSGYSLILGLLEMLNLSLDLTLIVHILPGVSEEAITIMSMSCPWVIHSIALLVDSAEKADQVDALMRVFCSCLVICEHVEVCLPYECFEDLNT